MFEWRNEEERAELDADGHTRVDRSARPPHDSPDLDPR
jgi:hypothetical protein